MFEAQRATEHLQQDTDEPGHHSQSDALLQAGFISEAELQFRYGLKLQPAHGRAYLHLGEIYQNNYHDKRTALFCYLKYLCYSNDPTIKARLVRLAVELERKRDIALRLKNYINRLR